MSAQFAADVLPGRRDLLRAAAGSVMLGYPSAGLLPQSFGEGLRVGGQALPGRAKACIILFMWGGPAQQDTWDMKPEAPR